MLVLIEVKLGERLEHWGCGAAVILPYFGSNATAF